MSKVFITGDVHCPHDIHKLNSLCFPIGNTLTKDDIVIICGDAGFIWNEAKKDWIEWIDNKPWTTVYVDGNHENFDLLNQYPLVDFNGAKAHQISKSLYHILRGEIMTINNETYFCFGGAFSHDKEYRTENIDWWQDELPTLDERNHALDNLEKYNYQVDYIITHDAPLYVNNVLGYRLPNMMNYNKKAYINICEFFQDIMHQVTYKQWFCGHYHIDEKIRDIQVLYHTIVEINKEYTVYNNINILMEKTYTREEIKDIGIKNKLFVNNRKMGTNFDFGTNEYCISIEDFFKKEVTDLELNALSYLYNKYIIEKQTYDD
jgi:hypothetical protein